MARGRPGAIPEMLRFLFILALVAKVASYGLGAPQLRAARYHRRCAGPLAADNTAALLFDCDGVLVRHSGSNFIARSDPYDLPCP